MVVETIPDDVGGLPLVGGATTAEAWLAIIEKAEETLDISMMYWSLRPVVEDEFGYTAEQLASWGVEKGEAVLGALYAAAGRGVMIRIVQSPGFVAEPHESHLLAVAYPEQVTVRTMQMEAWFESGIMHQKMMVADGREAYIGSANMDWRALAQVKEVGLWLQDDEIMGAALVTLFERWWLWAAMVAKPVMGRDKQSDVQRLVPKWSKLVQGAQRVREPWGREMGVGGGKRPLHPHWNNEPSQAWLALSPPEVMVAGEMDDETSWLHGMRQARETIDVSVMDCLPLSLYWGERGGPPLWWPTLFDGLVQAALARRVRVRLLVSEWAQTPAQMLPFLRAWRTAVVGVAPHMPDCLQIKRFVMPGWSETVGVERAYPAYSRVNHPKYMVTDSDWLVGTSNWAWGYFHTTAGISLCGDYPEVRHRLATIFDRDWSSPYAREI